MKRPVLLLLLLSLFLLAACAGTGDETPPGTAAPSAPPETAQPGVTPTAGQESPAERPQRLPRPLYAAEALSYPLVSQDGGQIGALSEIIVDSLSGEWLYLVVSAPLAAGLESGSYPVPLGAVELRALESGQQPAGYFLRLPEEQLEGAPTLDETFLAGEAGQDIDPLTWDDAIRAFWAQRAEVPNPEEGITPGVPLRLSTSPLTGMRLPLVSGDQPIGNVTDLIFDRGGWIEYALLGLETGLGLPGGEIPIPWAGLLWNASQNRFDLDVDAELLAEAPVFESGAQRPDLADEGWRGELAAYWQGVTGLEQAAEVEPLPQDLPTRAAQLMGNMLVDENGNALGVIEDLTLGSRGQVEYVIANLSGRYTPIPLGAAGLHPQSGALVYRGGVVALNGAPYYRGLDDIPYTYTPGWDERFRMHWGRQVGLGAGTEAVDAGSDESQAELPLRASALFNRALNDSRGNPVGVAADMILATPGGSTFIVLDNDLRLVPVPWRYFRWDRNERQLYYTAPLEQLRRAPAFDAIPQLMPALPTWEQPILDFWG